MKLNHPNFQNANQNELSSIPPQKILHTVMSKEDEDFMKQVGSMVQQEKLTPPAQPIIDDVLVKQEAEKKTILEKIVLFKEPCYKEIVIKGVVFRLKLLSADENSRVYNKIRQLPAEEQLTRTAIIMLAAALVDANGIKIEDTYEGPAIDDVLTKRYHELCKWNMPLINTLISAYRQFSDEIEGEYTKDFLASSQQTHSTD